MLNNAIAVAVLASFGCGGGGNPTPDCASAVAHAMAVSKAEIEKESGMTDAIVARMTDITLAHCTADAWPGVVIGCLGSATSKADTDACVKSLVPDVAAKWRHDMATAADLAAGSTSSPTVDLPPECLEYRGIIGRLARCEKLPLATRNTYLQAYGKIAPAFLTTPTEGRAQLASGCKTTVDVIKKAAAATCGW